MYKKLFLLLGIIITGGLLQAADGGGKKPSLKDRFAQAISDDRSADGRAASGGLRSESVERRAQDLQESLGAAFARLLQARAAAAVAGSARRVVPCQSVVGDIVGDKMRITRFVAGEASLSFPSSVALEVPVAAPIETEDVVVSYESIPGAIIAIKAFMGASMPIWLTGKVYTAAQVVYMMYNKKPWSEIGIESCKSLAWFWTLSFVAGVGSYFALESLYATRPDNFFQDQFIKKSTLEVRMDGCRQIAEGEDSGALRNAKRYTFSRILAQPALRSAERAE